MASNKPFRFGPTILSTVTTTNILNPGTTTGGVASTAAPYDKLFIILRHIRVVNQTASAAKVVTFIGATTGNTTGTNAIFGGAASVGALTQGTTCAANSFLDWFGLVRLDTTDFLVGGADIATALTIEGEGEIGVS